MWATYVYFFPSPPRAFGSASSRIISAKYWHITYDAHKLDFVPKQINIALATLPKVANNKVSSKKQNDNASIRKQFSYFIDWGMNLMDWCI